MLFMLMLLCHQDLLGVSEVPRSLSAGAELALSLARGSRTVNRGMRHLHFGRERAAMRLRHGELEDRELDPFKGSSTSSSCISRRTCALSVPPSSSSLSRLHSESSSSVSTCGGRYPAGVLRSDAGFRDEVKSDCASRSDSGLSSTGDRGGAQSFREDEPWTASSYEGIGGAGVYEDFSEGMITAAQCGATLGVMYIND